MPQTLRFAANLSLLFTEVPLLERPAAAHDCGFDAVELWWPFSKPVPTDGDLDRLADALDEAGVRLIALNFDGGDMSQGERGLLTAPGMQQRFKDNVDCVISFAQRTGTRVFNALYGNEDANVDHAQRTGWAIEGLEYAARAVRRVSGTVVVETQNAVDSPRYPLVRPEQVRELIASLSAEGQESVGFLADLYHLAMSGLDPRQAVADYFPLIRHVQIADAPGRHEPGSGTISYADVLGDLLRRGYDGWIAAEYRPAAATRDGLAWLPRLRDEIGSPSRDTARTHGRL
ncbi:MAG TPA: TIM barrel protein [Trebonia sp.]